MSVSVLCGSTTQNKKAKYIFSVTWQAEKKKKVEAGEKTKNIYRCHNIGKNTKLLQNIKQV